MLIYTSAQNDICFIYDSNFSISQSKQLQLTILMTRTWDSWALGLRLILVFIWEFSRERIHNFRET